MISMERQLRELNDFDPCGANVLSIYLPTDPLRHTRAEVGAVLARLSVSVLEGLGTAHRAALEEELTAVRDYLGSMIAPPGGIAIFSCAPRRFFRIVRLPVEVGPAAYWAPWLHVAPLHDVAEYAAL